MNTKQQTLQYNTIPDGGDDDVVVLENPQEKSTPWSTGRFYSAMSGLVLLLVAAVVVLNQGGGGHDDHNPPHSDPAGSHGATPPISAEGQVLASITNLRNEEERACPPFSDEPCDYGCCYGSCC